MSLNRVVCTTCGNTLEASLEESTVKCDACGNTFLVTNGLEFAGKSEEEIGSIKKLRNNLDRAVIADDQKNILHFSKEILRLIPKDDLANYYYAYANYTFGSRKYLFDYYDQEIKNLPKAVDEIIEHIISYSDVRDKSLIETFIARNSPTALETYRQKYNQKLIDEENYSSIPRDVFISFRSSEIEDANEVLEILEKDGVSCWISSRNLRPNDNENYWTNIEDAITKSKIFLVISSHDAMISRDVKKEIDIAGKQQKQRIEYKIDKTRHTSVFKYFFDGYKWIDATENKQDALEQLKRRVYELINSSKTKEQKKNTKVKSQETDEYRRKINRCNVELLGANFVDASNTVKDALGINPEATEAWWLLFLAENKFTSEEMFASYIDKKQTLSKLFDMYNRVSYKQYRKYMVRENEPLPQSIVRFETYIYDDMLEYINKKNLPEKSKRDFLNSYCPDHILTIWANIFLPLGFNDDETISEIIDNDKRIKELENIFEDFDNIMNHPMYDKSHLKEYRDRFYKNYERTIKRRETNLKELNAGINKLYQTINHNLEDGKYKDANKNSLELFYFDNTSFDKYYYLLLSKLRAKNSVELYDQFNKVRKKDKIVLMNSMMFERLFNSEKYHELMYDLILHSTYRKRKKAERIIVEVRGEENGM